MKRSICALLSSAAFFSGMVSATVRTPSVPFPEKERIVFLGDSITHGDWQSDFVNYYLTTRFPGKQYRLYNRGIAGDTAWKSLQRLSWDLYPDRPDTVLVMFGMNDVGRELYAGPTEDPAILAKRTENIRYYELYLQELVAKLKAQGCSVILITPSPYDQYGSADTPNQASCNEGLAQCAEVVRKIADIEEVGLVELHTPMTALFQAHPEAAFAGSDRTHPTEFADWFMTMTILKALQAPATVAAVTIDADNTVAAQNCLVSELQRQENTLRFRYQPEALPLYMPESYRQMEQYVDLTRELNQEMLVIRGLADGEYRLCADGQEIGKATAAELADGINLALLPTPNQRKAQEAFELIRRNREAMQQLRSCAYAAQIMTLNGVDPTAPGAADKFFPTFIAAHTDDFMRGHVQGVYDSYRANNGRRSELEQEIQSTQQALSELKPEAWLLEVNHSATSSR